MSEFTWVVDRNFSRSTKPTTMVAQFGDGYSHRAATTLNSLVQSWNVTFKNRDIADINDIINFFETRAGTVAFTWTPPGGTEVKVICKEWKDNYVSPTIGSVSATFERVYE